MEEEEEEAPRAGYGRCLYRCFKALYVVDGKHDHEMSASGCPEQLQPSPLSLLGPVARYAYRGGKIKQQRRTSNFGEN